MLQVIGAGVGRTGTHSLKVALERLLGGRCHHMVEVFADPGQVGLWTAAIEGRPVDWAAVMDGYDAQVDWPGASFWPELLAANPDALVLLSVRDPEEWYASAVNTIFTGLRDDVTDPWFRTIRRMMADRFCDRVDDRDEMISAYHRHNQAVRAGVPPSQLLEWAPSDGWEPICARLGVEVPAEPFPLTNTTGEFRQMMGLPAL